MGRPFSDYLLEFVAALRVAGVQVSVAESLDATRAVRVAGLAPRRMCEALRAALIKDEADNPTFDELFARHFRGTSASVARKTRSSSSRVGVAGSRGSGDAAALESARAIDRASETGRSATPEARRRGQLGTPKEATAADAAGNSVSASAGEKHAKDDAESRTADATADALDRDDGSGMARARLARQRRIERLPFVDYTPADYEQARAVLALLRRRWRLRRSRRHRANHHGRLDFRRTLRASLQHGGIALERRFRARRPRHLDLVVLADVSGSMHHASLLVLELMVAAAREFRRMRGLVFIDRVATADFEDGHLVTTPVLDRYARSDAGRAFGEIRANYLHLLSPATVMVILGDARNNRRPPLTNLLRDIGSRCGAVLWLNPEPVARWGTGDSAIEAYRRVVNFVLPCGSLNELARCLSYIC